MNSIAQPCVPGWQVVAFSPSPPVGEHFDVDVGCTFAGAWAFWCSRGASRAGGGGDAFAAAQRAAGGRGRAGVRWRQRRRSVVGLLAAARLVCVPVEVGARSRWRAA